MNRRKFIKKTVSGIIMLGSAGSVHALSINDYVRNDEEILLRFAVASDGHYGQPDTQYDRFHDDMMNWLTKEHKQQPLAFCLFNGDLIHDDVSLFKSVKKKYDMLPMPYYVSRGNHDRCDLQTWESTWGHALNYSFEIGDSAFVVLDTANAKGEVVCPDIAWAEQELAKHRAKKHLFIFMHVTPLPWTKNGLNCESLVSLFSKQKNLKAVFHGHDHDQDDAKIKDGKPYFFDAHLGGNWGTIYRGYRIVEVLKSNKIVTYQVNPVNERKVNTNKIDD